VGRDSAVGIATRYALDGPGIESRRGASFFAFFQTGRGAHPASCTMGTGSSPGVKRPGRGVDHSLLCSAKIKERQQSCIRVLRVRISAKLEKKATVVWSCFWDPWIRRNRYCISRNNTYKRQGMYEDKKHTYVLFFDLTFACFSASYSYTANDRKLGLRRKALCYVLLPCGMYKCFSIPTPNIYLYNHRFHSPYKWCHIYQVILISFDIILSLCSSYLSCPSLIAN
jgi:hypothetical protein